MHFPNVCIGVTYLDTPFVDNRDRDEINPMLLKFPDTVDGPALMLGSLLYIDVWLVGWLLLLVEAPSWTHWAHGYVWYTVGLMQVCWGYIVVMFEVCWGLFSVNLKFI